MKETRNIDFFQAVRSGLPIAWPVDEAHIVRRSPDRTILTPDVSAKAEHAPRLYAPSTRLELPGELAKLARGDEKAVVEFANTYGLLGYTNLSEDTFSKRPVGDPLNWVWSHAETVRMALAIKTALDDGNTRELRQLLRPWESLGEGGKSIQWFLITIAVGLKIERRMFFWDRSLEDTAAGILRTIINQNIAGICPKVAWDSKQGTFTAYTSFRALIEALYWHLFNAVATGRIAQCRSCGSRFIQTDFRQRFCPTRDPRQESPCAVRARVKKWRQSKQLFRKKGVRRHGTKR